MKKLIVYSLMTLVLIMLLYPWALADEINSEIVPFYQHTEKIFAKLSIDSSGIATCAGEVVPKKSSYSCSIMVRLQQKAGSGWNTVVTWTGSGEGYAGASAEGV